MRKGRDGEKKKQEKNGKKKPGKKREKADENSGHYVIASSGPPERRPLERRPLVPIEIHETHLQMSKGGIFPATSKTSALDRSLTTIY